MKRPYRNKASGNGVKAFVGLESDQTLAKGKLTLFVVGRPKVREVIAWIDQAQETPEVIFRGLRLSHVYFGANQSFDGVDFPLWVDMIKHFLREGMWCTLNIKLPFVPLLTKTDLCRHSRFIPVVSVRLPSARALGYNAILRLDDLGFATTNPAVWSTSLSCLLMDPKARTCWQDYSDDFVIDPKPRTKE